VISIGYVNKIPNSIKQNRNAYRFLVSLQRPEQAYIRPAIKELKISTIKDFGLIVADS
jgi:hypothetical protein